MFEQYQEYTTPLHRLAHKLQPKTVLEIGIGTLGLSTRQWLAAGAQVTTIDKNNINDVAGDIQKLYGDKFSFINQLSQKALPELHATYELIFIDGDHSYEGARRDIELCIPKLAPNGVLVLDDYGVESGVVDVDEGGNLIEGDYGVKQAADDVLNNKHWERWNPGFALANGAAVYRRAHHVPQAQSRKRR